MKSEKLFDLVQLVTGLAVVVGLGLVIWELIQARELARAQLISDSYQARQARHTAVMGDNASLAIAKACRTEDMTPAEVQIVSAYYQAKLDEVLRRMLIGEETGLYTKEDWEAIARLELRDILSHELGRAFWKNTSYIDYMPELAQTAKEVAAEIEPSRQCARWAEPYLSAG